MDLINQRNIDERESEFSDSQRHSLLGLLYKRNPLFLSHTNKGNLMDLQ